MSGYDDEKNIADVMEYMHALIQRLVEMNVESLYWRYTLAMNLLEEVQWPV